MQPEMRRIRKMEIVLSKHEKSISRLQNEVLLLKKELEEKNKTIKCLNGHIDTLENLK